MFIKKIFFKNHIFWGDIEFDFCDSNDIPFKTIIIAGENGTGKSMLLNLLHDLLDNLQPGAQRSSELQITIFQITKEEMEIIKDPNIQKIDFSFVPDYIDLIIQIDNNQTGWEVIMPRIEYEVDGQLMKFPFSPMYLQDQEFNRNFKSIFSEVEVNYTPKRIDTVSSLDIDQISNKRKSTADLATEITQLLVDIEALDNADFAEWWRKNKNNLASEEITEEITDKRMIRFKNAFHSMFPNKKYEKIQNDAGSKKVLFKEGNRLMSINQLSSGEKQIVFRGSFLLKDQLHNKQAIVLIDEPELSLHPDWQLKILDFYKNLFTDSDGIQQSQMFITTHSPFIIHNQNSDTDKIIVLAKNNNGIIVQKHPRFYSWTAQTAITEAFDIKLNFDNTNLVVYVEGETDELYINLALNIFKKNWPVTISWIGRKEAAGPKFTGDKSLTQAKEYLISNTSILPNKFLLLYDSDTKVKNETLGNEKVYVRCLSSNPDNSLYKIGIENLLTLPEDFPDQNFYNEKVEFSNYGAKKIIQDFDKMRLCNYICNTLTEKEQLKYLSKFEMHILELIEGILY